MGRVITIDTRLRAQLVSKPTNPIESRLRSITEVILEAGLALILQRSVSHHLWETTGVLVSVINYDSYHDGPFQEETTMT